jgi:hypothetical protein
VTITGTSPAAGSTLTFPLSPKPGGEARAICYAGLWVGQCEYVHKLGPVGRDEMPWTWQASLFRRAGRLPGHAIPGRAPLGLAAFLRHDHQPALMTLVRQHFWDHGPWWARTTAR